MGIRLTPRVNPMRRSSENLGKALEGEGKPGQRIPASKGKRSAKIAKGVIGKGVC